MPPSVSMGFAPGMRQRFISRGMEEKESYLRQTVQVYCAQAIYPVTSSGCVSYLANGALSSGSALSLTSRA